jgi:hypothetical protein
MEVTLHMRLKAAEAALRGILETENRGKDRKMAESVATLVLEENMTYEDAQKAAEARQEGEPRRRFYEGADRPDPEVVEKSAEEATSDKPPIEEVAGDKADAEEGPTPIEVKETPKAQAKPRAKARA